MCQAIEEFKKRRVLLCIKLWGISICKVLFCHKLLRDGNFRFVIFLKHAKSVLDCGSSYIVSTLLHVAIPGHHLIIYLKHPASCGESGSAFFYTPPSFGDPGSSYILNTLFHVASPVHHISSTSFLLWRFPFIIISIS